MALLLKLGFAFGFFYPAAAAVLGFALSSADVFAFGVASLPVRLRICLPLVLLMLQTLLILLILLILLMLLMSLLLMSVVRVLGWCFRIVSDELLFPPPE